MTTEQLEAIEKLAYSLFSPMAIAINLEIDQDCFLEEVRDRGSAVHKAYYKGYLRQLAETREKTIEAARNGSNPAQMELVKFIRDIENEILYG